MDHALEAWPIELGQAQLRLLARGIQFLGAAAYVPPGLEGRNRRLDLAEIDSIGTRVRSSVRRIFDCAPGNGLPHDFRKFPHLEIFLRDTHVKRLVVDGLPRCFQDGEKSPAY